MGLKNGLHAFGYNFAESEKSVEIWNGVSLMLGTMTTIRAVATV